MTTQEPYWRSAMETMLGKHSFPNRRPHRLWAVGLSFLMTVMLIGGVHGTAFGQEISVNGTVTEKGGFPLRGVTVRVTGSDATATTNQYGRYTILAPSNGELSFTLIGQKPAKASINGRTTVDVTLDRISFLEEVVVTAYSESQKRSEITGAVSGVNAEQVQKQTGASVLQRLDAAVPGITVDASGSPGSRSTVRIRGVSSFQNNDPLYIVDGVALQDSYINWLNPNDIQSIQVLKDASAASIYGARASNGVVIIETTKRGSSGPPKTTVRIRSGVASPVRGYDDFMMLNALDYYNVVKTSYLNAGYPIDSVPSNVFGNANSPTVPGYIWPNNCGPNGGTGVCSNVDPKTYSYPTSLIMPGSNGTNWWKEVFHPAYVGDYNMDVSGGGVTDATGKATLRLKDVTCLFAPPQAGENFLVASAPINVVATPRSQSAIHATVRASLVSADRDAQIEVFTWDAQGQPAGGAPFYWRCTVALEENVG